MARPLTASDADILNAAGNVIARRGPDAFSLAEVAEEVGLSRAAIILRFKSTRALKITLLTKLVESFANDLRALPKSPSGDNLLRVAAFIGTYVHSRESSARFFANFTANLQDRELLELESKRGEALRTAISDVMPEVNASHEAAVNAFRTHLTGNIMSWLSLDDADSRGYLVRRTMEWLRLVRVPFSEEVARELLNLSAQGGGRGKRAANAARVKTTRTRKRGLKA
jgi:TetR/AcrR family macrolide resistance operon transcriptional repressor